MNERRPGLGAFLHHERSEFLIGQLVLAFIKPENFPLQVANDRRHGAVVSRQLALLFRGALPRRHREQVGDRGRQRPKLGGIRLARHREPQATHGVVVAVVGVESKTEFCARVKTHRRLQFSDEKMPLAKPGADGPAGFWIAIHRVFGAIVLLFPIGGRLAEEDCGRSGPGARPRRRCQAEFVQDEIAGLTPAARAVLGQAGIRQHFQQDRRDIVQAGLGLDLVGVVG